jgi:hypothetical protein
MGTSVGAGRRAARPDRRGSRSRRRGRGRCRCAPVGRRRRGQGPARVTGRAAPPLAASAPAPAPVQVHLRRRRCGRWPAPLRGIGHLGAGHQAQVALGHRQPRVFGHRAEHRHVGVVLDHRAQLGFVARAADAVEDHAADADVRGRRPGSPGSAARCRASCRARRSPAAPAGPAAGQRGVAVAAVQRQAVVQALVAFDQRQIGARHCLREAARPARRRPSARCGSRLKQGRPLASASHIGSM